MIFTIKNAENGWICFSSLYILDFYLNDMKKIVFLVLLLMMGCVVAQPVSNFTIAPQRAVKLPADVKNLSIVDRILYLSSCGVMVSVPLADEYVSYLQPDTTMLKLGSKFEYVVRNPRDSFYYFSYKGESTPMGLYMHVKDRGRKNVIAPIRGWNKDICHPAFSPDGNMVVFSSQSKVGLGGYDLWCSVWTGKKWTKPVNMGNIINTSGNETAPIFYDNFLIYSSNGNNDKGVYSLYAAKLHSYAKVNDIIFDKYEVQKLPYPINSDSNDVELVLDTVAHRGFWISSREGKNELYSFTGDLDCVLLSGTVQDEKGRPISEATIKIISHERVLKETQTDHAGAYELLLAPDDEYEIRVEKENFFDYFHELPIIRLNEDFLIASASHNVVLPTMPINRPLIFDKIYREGADVELSTEGMTALSPVFEFVRENPNVALELTLYCYQTADEEFNNMIIYRRINYLQKYVASVLPPECQISFRNGNETGKIDPNQMGRNPVFVNLFLAR